MAASIKTEEEISVMREGGRRMAAILNEVAAAAEPGVSSAELDERAERLILSCGGVPVFKGYRISGVKTPYSGSICVSVNAEVVHGIPRKDRIFRDGDVASIDIGMRWSGLVTDMAVTIGIGKTSPDAQRLIRETKEALGKGIAAVRSGNHIGDIGNAVAKHLNRFRFGVIRDLAGHGVGYELHEDPLIPNYGKPGGGEELREGMVIAIEPMATLGSEDIVLDNDEWTFRTADGSLAAHFEHTIAVTKSGAEVLTLI